MCPRPQCVAIDFHVFIVPIAALPSVPCKHQLAAGRSQTEFQRKRLTYGENSHLYSLSFDCIWVDDNETIW